MPRTLDGGVRKFEGGNLYEFQIIARETPPSGYQPAAKLESCDPKFASMNEPTRRMGVVTIAIGDGKHGNIKMKTKIEHVDDSEPIQAQRADDGFSGPPAYVYMVPIVGPAGERLSVLYRDDGRTVGFGHLTPLGPPVPRLHTYCGGGVDTALAVAGKEPGFYIPVSANGTMPTLHPDVVGAKRIEGAWLVRWNGTHEGWSVANTRDLGAFTDQSPRYKSVRELEIYDHVDVVVGERPDGSCEVTLAATGSSHDIWSLSRTSAPDCATAVVAMETDIKKRRAVTDQWKAQQAADDAKRDAENAVRAKQATEARRAATAEAERLSKAEAEKRKQEEPILREYMALRVANKWLDACRVATGLPIESHARFIGRRNDDPDLQIDEVDCVISRHPPSAIAYGMDVMRRGVLARDEARQRRAEEEDAEDRRAERRASKRALRKEGPSAGSTQTPDRVNDYLYGSGRSSSCPFADKSYCY